MRENAPPARRPLTEGRVTPSHLPTHVQGHTASPYTDPHHGTRTSTRSSHTQSITHFPVVNTPGGGS